MCARRFLTIIFVLTLLAVGGAFAIYQWGGRVLINQAIPKGHFEAAAAGGAPDYSLASNWIARPGMADDPSRWTPAGIEDRRNGNVAVFYVHPTTYLVT